MRLANKFTLYIGGTAIVITLVVFFYFAVTLNSLLDHMKQNRYTSSESSQEELGLIVEKKINFSIMTIGSIGCLGLAIFYIGLAYISQKIVLPLEKAIDFSNGLARGDFSKKLPRGTGTEEIEELIKALNFMRDRMQNSIIKLEKSHIREKQARKDAESAHHLKTDFLANMSLELRNPLNAIMGLSRLIIEESTKGRYDEELKRKISAISKSAELLNTQISNLLELSRLDSGDVELNISEFETADFMRDLADFNRLAAEDKNLMIESHHSSEIPEILNTDRDILFHVISIMISCLIKETPMESVISLGAKSSEEHIVFWVKGNTREENGESLTETFRTFRKSKLEHLPLTGSSTLMDLVLAESNAMLIGGNIDVETDDSKATVLNVKFNKHEITGRSREEYDSVHSATNWINGISAHNLTADSSGKNGGTPESLSFEREINVLLAEDNEANRMLIELMLKNTSCTLECVPDGIACLEVLERKKFDLLLLDLQMPNLDGFRVIEKIRSNKELDDMPIVVMTAYLEHYDKQKLILAGANECFLKPIEIDSIMKTIKNLTSA